MARGVEETKRTAWRVEDGIGGLGKKADEAAVEQKMMERRIVRAMHDLASDVRAGRRDGSLLSGHTDDGQFSI